jgi:hypothetical protein
MAWPTVTDPSGQAIDVQTAVSSTGRLLASWRQKALDALKRTPEGAASIHRVEAGPDLTVKFSDEGGGAEIDPWFFNSDGSLHGAVLTYKADFYRNRTSPPEHYPCGSKIIPQRRSFEPSDIRDRAKDDQERSRQAVYVVAHEEFGHYLSVMNSPNYARKMREFEEIRTARLSALDAIKAHHPGKTRRDKRAYTEERNGWLSSADAIKSAGRIDELSLYLEVEADAIGCRFLSSVMDSLRNSPTPARPE